MQLVGQIIHNPKHNAWEITCEPHVSMRLKRVFGKINVAGHGTHQLSNTLENARDLDWFLSRYPMQIAPEHRALLTARASAHVEQQGLIHKLLNNQASPKEFDLALPPRSYQSVAATLAMETGRLLLADDVGVGKTLSGICCLTDPARRPALVVTLTHLPLQWKSEIERFVPGMRVHIVKYGIPYDLTRERRQQVEMPDVLLINYHKLAGWAETLAKLVKTVIFDEVQELRRPDSNKYMAARFIAQHAQLRLGLSATPIYNFGAEFYSVLSVLAPGVVGSYDEFMREWCVGDSIKDPKAFGAYLREQGLMLRRTRADVGRELPGLNKIHHVIEADLNELDKVSKSCAELARLILSSSQKKRGEQFQASEEFTNRLRQATGIAKAPFVADFVRLLVASGEKVVLYGWHREVYSIWLDKLKDLHPVMYTGSESSQQKAKAKEVFVNGDAKVLIISLRAGAGLDGLQFACRTIVFGELDWSPGVLEQCIGRVNRDGQLEPVMAYYLVAEAGADPIMAEVLGLKRAQLQPVINPDASLVEKLERSGDHVRKLAENYLQQVGA